MSKIEVNAIEPQSGTTLTLGASGDTVALAAGALQSGFGRSGSVNWDTTPKTSGFTAVSGNGYFVNTTSAAITVTLPITPTAGDIVAIADYANTSATNNITVGRNGSLIDGETINGTIKVNGQVYTLVYVDATEGWKTVNQTFNQITTAAFISATGGTILTCGDFKTHVFTGPGTFTVSNAGNSGGSNSVEYMVVAGGGGSAAAGPNIYASGGGGGGGYRQNYPSPTTAGLPVTAQGYPITVGGGGSCGPTSSPFQGTSGSNSIFSTITSTGGGYGARGGPYPVCSPAQFGASGGSGGGGGAGCNNCIGSPGGTGNTPPVSPPQGNNGGKGSSSGPTAGGGGGGASVVGSNIVYPNPTGTGAPGGGGSPIATAFFGPTSPSYGTTGPAPGRYFAGGGGGGGGYFSGAGTQGNAGFGGGGQGGGTTGPGPVSGTAGTANTGGGAGGTQNFPAGQRSGNAGGSGIVAIRYKFQ
jgi:hypothetical protein